MQPPTVTRCRDNVIVTLCSISECSQHAMNDSECNAYGGLYDGYFNNAAWSEALVGRGKICEIIYIRDYTTDFRYYVMPYPNFDVLRENMLFYVENNGIGINSEGCHQGDRSIEFGDLRAYVLAKLMWDPYMTEEAYQEHINDFLQGYYGSGWEEIREYFDFVTASGDKRNMCFDCFAFSMRLFRPMDYALHEEELEALFDRAEAACEAAGETTKLQNIRYLRWGYEFMRLSSNYTVNWEFGTERIRADYQTDCKALHDAMEELLCYYDLNLTFYYRDGYMPIFWNEENERHVEYEMEFAGDDWALSNQKKTA